MKLFITLLTILAVSSCNAKANNDSDKITLDKNTTLILSDEVSDQSVAQILLKARELDAFLDEDQALYLVLNTPGGSISAGMELIDGLNALDRPVHTVTLFAASMGFQIAQGLKNRYITKNGELMSHRAYGGFKAEFGGKEPSQLTNRYNSWLEKIRQMDLQTVKRSKNKQTLQSYQDAYENELWISGNSAVSAGYADSVVSVKCNSSMNGTRNQEFIFFGMIINVTFSECPTITGPLAVDAKIKTNQGMMNVKNFKKHGGLFGTACLLAKAAKTEVLCAEDVSLTEEKIISIQNEVLNKNNNKKVIYMSF